MHAGTQARAPAHAVRQCIQISQVCGHCHMPGLYSEVHQPTEFVSQSCTAASCTAAWLLLSKTGLATLPDYSRPGLGAHLVHRLQPARVLAGLSPPGGCLRLVAAAVAAAIAAAVAAAIAAAVATAAVAAAAVTASVPSTVAPVPARVCAIGRGRRTAGGPAVARAGARSADSGCRLQGTRLGGRGLGRALAGRLQGLARGRRGVLAARVAAAEHAGEQVAEAA